MTDEAFQLLLGRLDAQDERAKEHGETMKQILAEAKRTNGRVSALEYHNAVEEKLAHREEQIISKFYAQKDRRKRFWQTEINVLMGGAMVIGGGAVASIGHAFGWW